MCDRINKKLEGCIENLSSLEEPEYWRDFTEHEIRSNITEINDTLKLAEAEGNRVIHDWTHRFAAEILKSIKSLVKQKFNDFSTIMIQPHISAKAVQDISKFIRDVYVKGLESMAAGEIKKDWLENWSKRKARMMVRRMEVDILFKISNLMYDEEAEV
jgi:endonuclease IV